MKRPVLALSVVVALVSLLASSAIAAPDRVVTIEKGKLKILHFAFAPSADTANSNPDVVGARLDAQRKRVLFEARDIGTSTWTVSEAREDGTTRRVEVQVQVVDAK